jgi:plasmid stabilization system protein ParE
MTYTIQFSPQASDDLTDILGFYKEQSSPDLQKRFIQALSTTLKTLQNSPKSYSIRFKNARCGVVKTFPYNIYYWVDDPQQTINLFAILHQSRQPKIWKRSL